jgi:uncharacterized delta-60 repeat protein
MRSGTFSLKLVTGSARSTGAFALSALVCLGSLVFATIAPAQSTVVTPIGAGADEADALAIQSDGKLVAAGFTNNGGANDDFALLRYNTDLTLDVSFDGDGIATTAFGGAEDRANAIAIQLDGKIVVAGHSVQGGSGFDFAVARYLSNGSLDATFGTGGRVTTDIGTNTDDRGRGVAIQSDGRIVVAGYSGAPGSYDFAVVRYNANGSLDASFDTDGKLTTFFTAGSDQAEAIAIQPDGKIVVAGNAGDPPSRDIVLARYDPVNGSLDGSFGTGGRVTTNVTTEDNARFLAVQSDSRIVLAGSTRAANLNFAVLRYNVTGALDPGFGVGGVATTDFGAGDDASYAVSLQPDGKIVAAGFAWNGSNLDFAVARYNTNGTADAGFGTGGRATAPIGASHDFGYGAAVQVDGRIVVAGTANNGGNYDVALARSCPTGSLSSNYSNSFGYRKAVTISSSRVGGSTDLVDFPVLVHFTDPQLALAAGRVQRADGADIVFREGCAGAALDHEVEKFDSGTGELIAWVRVPLLRQNMDTVLFLYYGNASVACSTQNPAGVWASHRGVWHLDETPPGPFADASANPNDATAAATPPIQVAGRIGTALQFDFATDRHLAVVDHSTLDLPTNMTVSAWVRTTSADAQDRVILAKWGGSGSGWQNYWLGKFAAAELRFNVDGGASQYVSAAITSINDGSWHYVVGVADAAGSALRLFVDGTLRASAAYDGTSETGSSELHLSNNPGWPSQFWDGFLDEARVSSAARGAGWIQTEYNNQSSPGTFASLGAEDSAPFTAPWVYGYRKKLTVDPARVTCGADVTNVPVLVSLVDPDLRTVAQGGHVAHSNGYDILFRDSSGVVTLDSEIEKYTSDVANGTLVAWVRVPTVSTSAPTDIYMYYGNSAVSCPAQTRNPTAVWDPSYVGVWHLGDPAGGKIQDSTANRYHGTRAATIGGGPIPNASSAIDGGHDFARANSDQVGMSGTASQLSLTGFTVETWMKTPDASVPDDYYLVSQSLCCDVNESWALNIADDVGNLNAARFTTKEAGVQNIVYGPVVTGNQWHHLAGVRTATELLLYVDGVLANAVADTRAGQTILSTSDISLGSAVCDLTNDHNGTIDEARVSNTVRSACSIETGYNNQKWPIKVDSPTCSDVNGFICVGPEEAGPPTAVSLSSFTARGEDGGVALEWKTGSETSNLGFHLHRSGSQEGPYSRITPRWIPGLGSSPEGARYSYRDSGLVNGSTYYYKLEDVESTGKRRMHGPVSATPAAGGHGPSPPEGSPGEDPRITVGDPSSTALHVESRGAHEVVVELLTGGFYATSRDDGTVDLEVPGYHLLDEVGHPSLPVRRTWLQAVAGRMVEIVSVERRDEQFFDHFQPGATGAPFVEANRRGIVRRGRNRPRASDLEREAYPREPARILSVGYQEDVKKALVEIAPLRWDGNRLVLTRRLGVRLAFRGRDPGDEIQASGTRRYRLTPSHAQRQVAARLITEDPGLHGVRFEEIFGRSRRSVPAESMRLSRLGMPVPFRLSSSPWGPGATLFFLSDGAAANPYGREAVYELEVGFEGVRMPTRSARPIGEPVPYYWERVTREENHLYQAALLDAPDRWLWSMLFAPVRTSYPFEVSAPAFAGESSRLIVWLQGVSDFAAAEIDHHVRLYVNGSFAAEAFWNGKEARRIDAELPTRLLHDGENFLEVENAGDTEADYSMVMLDRFEVSYPRWPQATNGRLEGRFGDSGWTEVAGLTQAIVLETSDRGLAWLEGAASTASGIRFRVEEGRTYLATDPGAVRKVVAIRRPLPSRLKQTRNRADYLMVGPRDFLEAASPLARHRRNEGLEVVEAPLEEIFSEFGFGEENPRAIRDFLSYAYHRWEKAPRYVVLLGDASYDFKDYLGTGTVNQVPPLMMKTTYLETASDPAYAAVNGDDLLPDLALGRLPAATVGELETMVTKILAWEEEGKSLRSRAVLVADNADSAGDFAAGAEALAASVLQGRKVEKIYLQELGSEATRTSIRKAFDEGSSLMSYIGHGGIHVWADENVLHLDDVERLSPQPEQPLLLTMNCLNGYFHFPYFDALAESLTKAKGKGAIASVAPSGLSVNDAAHVLHEALLEELVHGGHLRLGDAVLAAQARYAESGALPEMIAIYHLFGDPALGLR